MRSPKTGIKRAYLYDELELRTYKPKNLMNKSSGYYSGGNSNSRNSYHVVVKITGGANNMGHLSNHLQYISRNDSISLYDENGDIIEREELEKIFEDSLHIKNSRSNSRQFYNIVFSSHGSNDPEALLKAVLETANEEFEGYDFAISIHEDTENTHAHLVVARNSIDKEKRLEIRKGKLNQIKKNYNKKLNSVGIKSTYFEHKKKQDKYLSFKKRENKKKGYEVVDYGKAPYQFKKGEKESFYVLVKTHNGEIKQHWSKGLEEAIKANKIKKGHRITLKKTGVNENKESIWSIKKVGRNFLHKGLEGWHSEFKAEKEKTFKVVDYGEAPYRFSPKMRDSSYMIVRDEEGENKEIWGKKILPFIKNNNIKKGEKVNITDSNISYTSQTLNKKIAEELHKKSAKSLKV